MKRNAYYSHAVFSLGLVLLGCQAAPQPQPAAVDSSYPATEPTTQPLPVTTATITQQLAKVRATLDARLVYHITDPLTGQAFQTPAGQVATTTDPKYNLTGYPMAVIYAGMLSAADATGDPAYSSFVSERFQCFARTEPAFEKLLGKKDRNPYRPWVKPTSLDSCGAMGAAFIKAQRAGLGTGLAPLINRFGDFVRHQQYRLDDGTLARKRPYPQSIWADDMYMSVPLLSQLSALTNDRAPLDDAAWQVEKISDRLFVPNTGLYTHAWHASAGDDQPHYFWGRANGWCAMAMVELLDVMPADHPRRPAILNLLRSHAKGIASYQAGSGLWHQLLDRGDSYEETSASAMFTYALARGVNHGWLDAGTFGPVAIAGWKGIETRIDNQGRVTGTCVGTSYASDYPYYYNRKMTDDPHGYGPVLLAGSEIIRMLKNPSLKIVNAGTVTVSPR
jgi:rhamnogalacturonyl hydrolase YesR